MKLKFFEAEILKYVKYSIFLSMLIKVFAIILFIFQLVANVKKWSPASWCYA